ncbi:hypothetical protein EFS38_20230, partial [Dickeya undicola]
MQPGGLALAGANQSGSASGTTYAAVSDGTLVIHNPDGQQQDVSGLSRDTAGYPGGNGGVAGGAGGQYGA